MNTKNTNSASLEELRKMQDRGELHATRSDAPEINMPEEFWENAKIERPMKKTTISMRIDPDILEFFRAQGNGYQTKMHAVLRHYVNVQSKRGKTPS